ncbi:hypothetical protein M747DRAFT_218198, partial [Aspergillus niger ATCC 13496]
GEELKTSLVDEYANQKKPTDGEIYRKIRQYEGEDNEAFRERWLVRLSSSNQDRLAQLDKRRNHRKLSQSCRNFWSSLVDSDPISMKKIDTDTVDALQLLAPKKFRTDAKMACVLILSGQAFAEFSE